MIHLGVYTVLFTHTSMRSVVCDKLHIGVTSQMNHLNWVATNTLTKYVHRPIIERNLERIEKQRPLDQIHLKIELTIEACASDSKQLFLKTWLREMPIKAQKSTTPVEGRE